MSKDSEQAFEDGMEALSVADCQRLLGAGGVGILAMCGVAAPVLRPVNFAVHEGWVLIRTGEGQILEAAHGSEPASFAISEVDRLEHGGWSVIVTGKLAERSSLGDVADVPLRPWARAEKHHFVGLSIDQISGRRIARTGFVQ
jgi:nitroimidazol reductase NimA-like FMN-containing flavoprotein (pyridoxamine 5'-phosphate oxidase superfamily)